jgi:putative transposase
LIRALKQIIIWEERHAIALRFIQLGKPNKNAFTERFNNSVRREVPNAWLFDSLLQAQLILKDWRIEDNTVRSHDSLGKKTPLAYLQRAIARGNLYYEIFYLTGKSTLGCRR